MNQKSLTLIFAILLGFSACGGGSSESGAGQSEEAMQESITGKWVGSMFWGATRRNVEIDIREQNDTFVGTLSVSGCFNNVSLRAGRVDAGPNGEGEVVAFFLGDSENVVSVGILNGQLLITTAALSPEDLGATSSCDSVSQTGMLDRA